MDDDLNPKPVYGTLYDLIRRQWHSDADLRTGSEGWCETRVFCGNYDIIVETSGSRKVINRDIFRESFYEGGGAPHRICVNME